MKENVINVHLKSQSKSYYFLPKSPYGDILYYLTSMELGFTESSYYVERYYTDTYMINLTTKGKGEFIYEEKRYSLAPGSLIVAYLGNRNVLRPISDDFVYCSFHLRGGQISDFYRTITQVENNVFNVTDVNKFLSYFDEISHLVNKKQPDFFKISILLNKLLTEILQLTIEIKETYPPIVKHIYEQILNHNVTVTDIAKKLNFSPIYLERQFKKHIGISIREYIIKHKIEQAENLLLTSNLSVYEISQHLGYADSNGLISLFKKQHGCSPLAFKNAHKKDKK